jgi:hypothetical protein
LAHWFCCLQWNRVGTSRRKLSAKKDPNLPTRQVGGTFVMGPGNSCDYVHRSQFAGDHPDMAELLTAATGTLPDGSDFSCVPLASSKREYPP